MKRSNLNSWRPNCFRNTIFNTGYVMQQQDQYTPGHADGSICFYNKNDRYVIVGDVLFHISIGRTDLPTGNYDVLRQSIMERLFTLPDDIVVYPGHGPKTTIGFEKANNPFL